ncbi:MAG: response regulator [Candidatus Thiodiazotropha sp. (ex Lucinoma borealis)]|nr:response regulator [Candidatus Thiodiazotropha sp. (ex Lucinoma borealis)]
MVSKLFDRRLFSNSEYQQALVRLAIWLFSIIFMWLGVWTDHYPVDVPLFLTLYGWYFAFFIAVLISIVVWPHLPYRKSVTLIIDVSATSLAIVLTSAAISPFYLIYHWIFISYGMRYGKQLLMIASILSFSAYNLVLFYLQQWQTHAFDAFFFLFLLLIIPFYQYSLLKRLHLARQEAESAKKARGDFLATMTHELRTPLIGVIGMTRLLQGTPLDAEQKEYLHSIRVSTQLLRSLISDVLDLSKIDANKLELALAWFDIRKLVKEVSSSMAADAHEKQLEVYCWVDPKVQQKIEGDRLRISQIIFNLLGNAIKFTNAGYVAVQIFYVQHSSCISQPHILIKVMDSGIGIHQEQLERIFDSFWQADSSNNRRFEGAGLGTTIVHDLTRLMGGRITVSSQVGAGSTFNVRLPLKMVSGPSASLRTSLLVGKSILVFETDHSAMHSHQKMVKELGMEALFVSSVNEFFIKLNATVDIVFVCDSLHDDSAKEVLSWLDSITETLPVIFAGYRGHTHGVGSVNSQIDTLLKPFLTEDLAYAAMSALGLHQVVGEVDICVDAAIGNRSRINVLLAEDNAIAAKVLSTLLRQRGHQVKVTKDGVEALQAAVDEVYELAFIDLRMPNVDGIEFTRRYRNIEPKHRYMSIYALTANSVEDMLDHCIKAGMDGFLTKPVEPEILDDIINRRINTLGQSNHEQPLTVPG